MTDLFRPAMPKGGDSPLNDVSSTAQQPPPAPDITGRDVGRRRRSIEDKERRAAIVQAISILNMLSPEDQKFIAWSGDGLNKPRIAKHLAEAREALHGEFHFLQAEEVLEELFAAGGQDGLGVELDAFEFGAAVADAHDDAVVSFGGDGEVAR